MITLPPEKIGSFYLGAEYANGKTTEESVNYDARDLTTHAVCVGMTGSGKTGLCIGLLEEAAIDRVPALIIDPKGDMTNLLLQFEGLTPEEFAPWINPDDALRKGMSPEAYAGATAKKWKEGLAGWGIGTSRIKLLQESVDYTIFTPGSDAGIPVNILGSFEAPGVDFDSDAEMLRERIQGIVAALLGMINRKDDPSRSKEGILLSHLFEHHWRKGEGLDLAKIILGIQNPPMKKLGVFDLDTFFAPDDRFKLAMEFNTLVASPQFSYWLQGEPLDIDKLYFTAEGQARHSIFYIAHLSESERMFFVTLLLNSLIAWMRRQSGTTSLRSLLYFDEIFGYFPPTANPASKKPLLTILKQARAYGLGAILVTQNPVDIDYKGLSNAGTWFIGKMQTERDKMRVLDGLKGAIEEAGTSSDMDFDALISSLDSRVFLLHNVHSDEPVLMHTRWAISFLRGPLTRPQVKQLMDARKALEPTPRATKETTVRQASGKEGAGSHARPAIDPSIQQKFLRTGEEAGEISSIRYVPRGLAIGKVRFYNAKRNIDRVEDVSLLFEPPDAFGRVDWHAATPLPGYAKRLTDAPDASGANMVRYDELPGTFNTQKDFKSVEKDFSDFLYQNKAYKTYEHEKLALFQEDGESLEAFRMRINQALREKRDEEIDILREKYEDKLDRLNDRILREQLKYDEQTAELSDRRTAEMLGVAETIFSVFKGRRRSLSSAATKSRMRRKAAQRVESARLRLEDLGEDYRKLESEMHEKLEAVRNQWAEEADALSTFEVKPRRTDVRVDQVLLVWVPFLIGEGNIPEPGF